MILCGVQYVRVPSLQRALQTLFIWRNASYSLSPVSSIRCRRMYSRRNCLLSLSITSASLSVQGTHCKCSHTHAVPTVDLKMPPKSKSKQKKITKQEQKSEILKEVGEPRITQLRATIQETVAQCPDCEVVGKSERPEAVMELEENRPKKRKKSTVKVKREEEPENLPVYFPFEGDGVSTLADIIQVGTMESNDKQQEELFEVKQVERPEGRFYLISSDKGVCELPSVTTVLKSTVPKVNSFRLYNWTKSMIKQHGKSGYKKIQQEIVRKGRSFHQQLENKLLEEQADTQSTEPFLESLGENSGYFQSIHHVLQDITHIHALESVAVHVKLGYTGTFDCVAKYKDELCVIDWKTSLRPKPSLADCYDFPLQAAAYAGAVNQDPHYPIKVFNALIVVAYPNGEPAHAHFISHEQFLLYWARWLARLEEYRTMFAHDLSEVYS